LSIITQYAAQAEISMTAKVHTSNLFAEHKKKQDNTLLGPDFASGLPKKLPHLRQPGTLPQEGLAITAIRSNSYQVFCLLHM